MPLGFFQRPNRVQDIAVLVVSWPAMRDVQISEWNMGYEEEKMECEGNLLRARPSESLMSSTSQRFNANEQSQEVLPSCI